MGCCASAAVDPGAKDDPEDPPPTRVAPPAPPAPAPAASAAAGPAAADSTRSSVVLAAPPAMKRLDTVEALEAQIAAEHAARLERERLERRARVLRDASPPPSMAPGARRQLQRSKTTPVKRPPLNSAATFRDFSRARKRPTRAQTASRPLTAKSSPSLAAIVPGDGDAQEPPSDPREFELLSRFYQHGVTPDREKPRLVDWIPA